ncbi:adenylate/guanylate cyclase domain-containing protein [Insolitispirillum peregrinum]|uniref:adenylate/guanylate cyclase domain-containing protein n=1 Tax=Insolitispirillum peregrinum TaxID=80876 RepID=UPI00361F5873
MDSSNRPADEVQDDQPYPLQRAFRRHILPLLAVLMVLSALLSLYRGGKLAEDIYLQVAQERAHQIALAAQRVAPDVWRQLLSIKPQDAVPEIALDSPLRHAVQVSMADSGMARIKIYDPQGRLLFSTADLVAGGVDRAPELWRLLETQEPQIELQSDRGEDLYEIYVWLPDEEGKLQLVFELYEPAGDLNSLLLRNIIPQVAAPMLLLGGLAFLLGRMVARAQRDINRHSANVQGLRQRLQRLVSGQALGAALRADGDQLQSRVLDATLLYSDIRSFTSYAESNPPERVVALLNQVMAIQVKAVRAHHGDVDKMIGDALLAVFEGSERAARAVACAMQIQADLKAIPDLPRRVGIGLHDGYVIAGTIGTSDRQDFTVIGDAVNVSARLCSEAAEQQVVIDTATLARAGHPEGFGDVEGIQLKGRTEPLRIRRMTV